MRQIWATVSVLITRLKAVRHASQVELSHAAIAE